MVQSLGLVLRHRRGLSWIVAGGIALVFFRFLFSDSESAPEAQVRRGDLVISVEAAGTVESVESVSLGPPQIQGIWNYKIAMLAPEGQEVTTGTPVLRFDTSELESKLLEKLAERDSADKELEKQRTTLERRRKDTELELAEARARQRRAELKVAVPLEVAVANELEEVRIDLNLARLEVAHLEEQLEVDERRGGAEIASLTRKRERAAGRVEEIREQIRRLTVTAPRDGTVIYVTDWRGEKLKVGDEVWQGRKVVEIPDLERMRAEGEVDEADAGRLAEGQRVTLRLDAHPDVEYTGRVERIRRMVQRQSRINPLKVVKLDIELAETDPARMRPGMRFRGSIEVERREDVLLAPAEAVPSTAEGPVAYRKGRFGVTVLHPDVGARNAELVEIRSGLEAGDRVLLRPLEGAS